MFCLYVIHLHVGFEFIFYLLHLKYLPYHSYRDLCCHLSVIDFFQRNRGPKYDDVLLFMNYSEGCEISGRYIISGSTVPLYQEGK